MIDIQIHVDPNSAMALTAECDQKGNVEINKIYSPEYPNQDTAGEIDIFANMEGS